MYLQIIHGTLQNLTLKYIFYNHISTSLELILLVTERYDVHCDVNIEINITDIEDTSVISQSSETGKLKSSNFVIFNDPR